MINAGAQEFVLARVAEADGHPEDASLRHFLLSKLGPAALREAREMWPHPENQRELAAANVAAIRVAREGLGQPEYGAVAGDRVV